RRKGLRFTILLAAVITSLGLISAGFGGGPATAHAASTTIDLRATGAEETPPINETPGAIVHLVYDDATRVMSYSVTAQPPSPGRPTRPRAPYSPPPRPPASPRFPARCPSLPLTCPTSSPATSTSTSTPLPTPAASLGPRSSSRPPQLLQRLQLPLPPRSQ